MYSTLEIASILTLIAGLSTIIGGSAIFLMKQISAKAMSFILSLSAGAMIYIALVELLPESIHTNGLVKSLIFFTVGIGALYLIDKSIPYHCITHSSCKNEQDKRLYKTGSLIAIAIMLHNFPEGVAVFLSSLSSLKFGLVIAIITILHNIPEGIAIAAPIYQATKSRKTALTFTALAGFAEPLGGFIAYFALSSYLTPSLLTSILSLVAGIMVYISIDELLPECLIQGGLKSSALGFVLGASVIGLTLLAV